MFWNLDRITKKCRHRGAYVRHEIHLADQLPQQIMACGDCGQAWARIKKEAS